MTRIKICGIKTLHDALIAAEAGADMLGFNFHPKSVRYVPAEDCHRIAVAVRGNHPHIQLVGVFVNRPTAEILRLLEECELDLAQLSGDESPEGCAALAGRGFKAFHGAPRDEAARYARRTEPAFLIDGHAIGVYGGTGVAADWSSAAELAKHYPLLLAGGLTPDNVAQAVERVRPWGVDVASGVESRPGEKDASKVISFIQAVRLAEVRVR